MLGCQEGTVEIRAQDATPLVERGVGEGRSRRYANAVGEDIETAVVGENGFGGRDPVGLVAYIELDRV